MERKQLTRSQIRARMKDNRSEFRYWKMMRRMDRRLVLGDEKNARHFACQYLELKRMLEEKENKPKTGVKMGAKK